MEKYNLIIFRILVLIICNSLYSQNKTIVPINGTIVFEKKEIITDTLLYKNSFGKNTDAMLIEMRKEVLKERGYENSKIPDSLNQQINQMLEMMKSILLQEIISDEANSILKYHHSYKNTEIEEFISTNGEYGEKKLLTNFDDFENESLWAITGVEENRKETKIIKDFKCFKVVIYYFNLEEPPGFNSLLNVIELWVTEDIKSKFHPYIKCKEILEKYYPLHIKHTVKGVEGMHTDYEIVEFSLK